MIKPPPELLSEVLCPQKECVPQHRIWGNLESIGGSSERSSSGIDSGERSRDLRHRCSDVIFAPESTGSEKDSEQPGSDQKEQEAHAGSEVAGTLASNGTFPVIEAPSVLRGRQNPRAAMEEIRVTRSQLGLHLQPTSSNDAAHDADERRDPTSEGTQGGDATYDPNEQVGNNEYGEMKSIGSQLHASGACRPCLYFNSPVGCSIGHRCRFCHLSHPKNRRPRPCKAKRTHCKQIVNMLCTVFGPESKQFEETSEKLSSESQYMRSILRGGGKKNMREHAMNHRLGLHMPAGVSNMDLDYAFPAQQRDLSSASSAMRFQ